MAFQPSEKEKFLGRLMDVHREAQIAEIGLRFQVKEAEKAETKDVAATLQKNVDALSASIQKLSAEIDTLQVQLMEEWLAAAPRAIAALEEKSAGLQAAIGSIKKKLKIGQNVVKAAGFLDDTVAIARKALAGGL
jgi:chromosome segregation ATPase